MLDINDIKNIVIVGTGFMGYNIAHVCLMAGFEKVILYDIKMEIIENAAKQIEIGLKRCESMGKLGEGVTTDALMERLVKEVELEKAVKNADYIIEAAPEIMKVKQEVFKKLGEYAPPHAIIATNTSMMSISKIAEHSGRPEQVIGMHFFAPVIDNRLIEVIKGNKTSNDALDIGVAVGQKLPCYRGKRLIARIEKESPGHISNRALGTLGLYFSWIAEQALEKGISYEQIEADISDSEEDWGFFEYFDYIGLDVCYFALKVLEESLSPDFTPPKFLKELVEAGNLGAKTGKGFYEWPKGERYFFEWTKEGRPKIDKSQKAGMLDLELVLAIQLNEGCKLLEEGIAKGYKFIDDVLFAGLRDQIPGPFTTGKRNYQKWSKMLEDLAEKSGKNYFKPCDLMKSGGFIKMKKPKPTTLTV